MAKPGLCMWTFAVNGGPCRVNHAAVSVKQKIFSFGGYCNGADLYAFRNIEVFIFNTATLQWTTVEYLPKNSDHVPFHRYGHTVVAYDGKIYLWGGRNDLRGCNKLYCFDPDTLDWSHPEVGGFIPEDRDGHSACIIDDHMYVFGGYAGESGGYAQDLYSLDLKTFTWSIMNVTDIKPKYRDFHTASAVDGLMYVWGGRQVNSCGSTNEHYNSDMYTFNTKTRAWSALDVTGYRPVGRRSHSAVVVGKCILMFGGYNSKTDEHFNGIYLFDTQSCSWERLPVMGLPPCPRRRQSLCLLGKKIFLFGGTSPLLTIEEPDIDDSNYGDEDDLIEHDDIHVLDLALSLQTMCLLEVIKHDLDRSELPQPVKFLLKDMTPAAKPFTEPIFIETASTSD